MIDLSVFCFLTSSGENDKLNQYVQQYVCSLATRSGYSWSLWHSCLFFFFFSPPHFVFRTYTCGLKQLDFKAPTLCGQLLPPAQGCHKHFHHQVDNKPPSRGLLSGGSLYPLCQATIQQLRKIWLLYTLHLFFFRLLPK